MDNKWKILEPDPEKVAHVRTALKSFELGDELVGFVLYLLKMTGLFWDPVPAEKTTKREIEKKANDAKTKLERKSLLSERYQTLVGGRPVPIGPLHGRRPQPHLTFFCQLIYRHLEKELPPQENLDCTATVIKKAGNWLENFSNPIDAVRKRIKRGEDKDSIETIYQLNLWEYTVTTAPEKPPLFPFPVSPEQILQPNPIFPVLISLPEGTEIFFEIDKLPIKIGQSIKHGETIIKTYAKAGELKKYLKKFADDPLMVEAINYLIKAGSRKPS